jgi:hypothetical protein
MREFAGEEWVEVKGPPPPEDPESEAGIICMACRRILFPDTQDEVETLLREHEPHGEVYVATKEKDGSIIRRGRIRRSH